MSLALGLCAAAGAQAAGSAPLGELRSIRTWSSAEATRVVVELSRETKWKYGRLSNPERLFIDFLDTRTRLGPKPGYAAEIGDSRAKRVRAAMRDPRTARLVLDLAGDVEFELSHLTNPERLVIELRARGAKPAAPAPAETETAAAGAASRDAAGRGAPGGAGAEEKREAARMAASAKPEAKPEARAAESRTATGRPGVGPSEKAAETEAGKTRGPESEARKAAEPEARAAESRTAAASPVAQRDKAAESGSGATGGKEDLKSGTRQAAGGAAAEPKAAVSAEAAAAKDKGVESAAAGAKEAANPPSSPPKPARPMRSGGRSMTRALGLRIGRVVLDPGHGGHDEGTRGPTGLVEKELVLDVALRLGALIEERLGGEVVYTRKTDEFVGLEERTAIANEQRADLFLSIHANSSPVKRVSGAEVFFLNFTNSKEALEVAARENAGHNKSIFELRELLQKIALSEKLDESRELARYLQRELSREWKQLNPASRDRGVKMAPFVVLIGASMPSVLAEIGFVSNARDERMMKRPEFRQRLAEALYRGVESYAASLGQTQALRAASPPVGAQSAR
ncbi:MAG: N-acetylmuramoyl-L-alanine amidase [Bryobacteraceae bacterium]